MYFDSNKKEECCGCTACMNACPTSAIKMKEDEEGFLYPVINEESCIHCNLCRKVCCWENTSYDNVSEPITIASVLKDKEERQKSTSGGVFYAIAKWVINQGGIVYGAAFDKDMQLHHIGARSLEELQKIRGSKYLQSELGTSYKDVKNHLDIGQWVYFTGTGCQVAGLKKYLRKDYSNLITSDLVCHGVPSQKLFNKHMAYMEQKYHDKVVDFRFRDYKSGIGCETCYFEKREPIINPTYELSPYLYSFMYGFTFRMSCYECKFAKVPRQGDITLADFWGVEHFIPKIDRNNGVSLILLNTKKGEAIWNIIKGDCYSYKSRVVDAAKYNANLIDKSTKPRIRERIYQIIEEKDYSYAVSHYFRSPQYFKIKTTLLIHRCHFLNSFMNVIRSIKKLINNFRFER